MKNLSFKVPFPVGKIGETPFAVVVPPNPDASLNSDFADLSETVDSLEPTDPVEEREPEQEIDLENMILQRAQELVATKMELPMQAAQNVISALQEKFDKELHELQYSALKLACAIAGKIVHHEVKQNPDIILQQIKTVLNLCKESQSQTLLLNPEDMAFLQENLKMSGWIKNNFPTMKIEGDPNITRGGCKLELENSEVDATIESQLALIEKELL